MKIDIATLKESLESMDHLTSSLHRLRLSLLKVSHHTVKSIHFFLSDSWGAVAPHDGLASFF